MRRSAWDRVIGLGFRLLYNELAWTYDAVSWAVSLGEWSKWQRSTLPFVSGPRVLEVGHGPGHVLATLEASGHSVFGLDISPYMGKLAQKRTAALLVRGRAQELPFCPDAFDSVVSTFPTEFIFSRESLAAIHRVLKPGGLLVVLPEGHLTGNSPLHRFIEWLYKITGQSEGVFALDLGQQAVNVPPWQLVQELFIAAGFQARLEHHQLAKSAVTIVLACKAG